MTQEFVQVRGKDFILKDHSIYFYGLGVGSWLNMEHFMLGIPTPDSQIRDAFAQVYGEEKAHRFFDKFITAFLTEDDFIFLKQTGINLIRVPFNYRLFIDDNQPDTYKKEGFTYFDSLLALCRKYEIYLLPDLHTVPGGQNPDWHSDNSTGIPQFWHFKVFRDQIVSLWGAIAKRYCEEPFLLGYDVLNEPFIIPKADILHDFYQEVTAAIRKADPHHIIFLEGDFFAMDFTALKEIPDAQTALTFHYYPTVWDRDLLSPTLDREERFRRFSEILTKITAIRDTFSRPILCGEAGYDIRRDDLQFSLALLEDTLRLFRRHSVSYTLWCYKDAQFMGLVYPKTDSPWMRFAAQVRAQWTHYGEMSQADTLINTIAASYSTPAADAETLNYHMQFRLRTILYRYQAECILKPLLENIPYEQILQLPDSFAFHNCEYYEEYCRLLQQYTV